MFFRIFKAILTLLLLTILNSCGGSGGDSSNADQTAAKSDIIILSVSTELDDTKKISALAPARTATLVTDGLVSADTLVVLTQAGKQVIIQPTSVSIENQTIRFTPPSTLQAGVIALRQNEQTSAAIDFSFVSDESPILLSLEPSTAKTGDRVTVTGVNLPEIPLQLQFSGQDKALSLTVTPYQNQFSFYVPQGLKSGDFEVLVGQLSTNKLNLAVKRELFVNVELADGLRFNAEDISFVLGGYEYVLDNGFNASIPVNNANMQFIHTSVDLKDGSFALLYSALVLPSMTDTVTVNAHSTAISWLFIGLGGSVLGNSDSMQALYERIAVSQKTDEFAAYIASLQRQSFESWNALDDDGLQQKFLAALKALSQTANKAKLKATKEDDNPFINITQKPLDNNIYVDNLNYNSVTEYRQPLKNGNVSLVNDTKLFLSVEARSKEDGLIINDYEHSRNIIDTRNWGILAPKGWGLLGIASALELKLEGEDAQLEIIAGSWTGDTDRKDIAENLLSRVYLDGVAMPILNMVLSTMVDRGIPDSASYKDVIAAMNDIYGTNFLKDLNAYLANPKADWEEVSKIMLFNPLKNSFDSCFSEPVGGGCRQLATGFSSLMGYSVSQNVHEYFLLMILESANKRVIKQSAILVPGIGFMLSAAFFIHDNIGYVSDTATIAESFVDMRYSPREINVEVEFAFDLTEVSPVCVAIGANDSQIDIEVFGSGFVAEDNTNPLVSLGAADEKILPYDQFTKADGSQILAHFNVADVMPLGSRSDFLFVSYDGFLSLMYPHLIEFIDATDEYVIFDEITPYRAETESIITLKGCGWIPLDDVAVHFTAQNGEVTGELVSKSIDSIQVKVPTNAVSGMVYVTAGNKTTRKLHFNVHPFSLKTVESNVLQSDEIITLTGKALDLSDTVVFSDEIGNVIAGDITSKAYYELNVRVPTGLSPGKVDITAEKSDGRQSNAVSAVAVPTAVTVNPSSQSFENSFTITLSQSQGANIFYFIDDGVEQAYSAPIKIALADSAPGIYQLTAYARVVVDGQAYDSALQQREYELCSSSELLQGGVCVDNPDISTTLTSCPLEYDPSLYDGTYSLRNYSLEFINDNGESTFVMCRYYFTPQLASEEYFINGKRNGITKHYYTSGLLKSETPYVNGDKNGVERRYLESGQLNIEVSYVNDLYDGFYKMYRTTGELSQLSEYKEGKLNGLRIRYNLEGIKQESTAYLNGKKHGDQETFYETGELRSVHPYVSGLRDGIAKSYYSPADGSGLKFLYTYSNGKLHGDTISYFQTGNISSLTPYIGGKRNGVSINYSLSGAISSEEPYVNDLLNGTVKKYFETGMVWQEIPYVNHTRQGQLKQYSSEGVLVKCQIYDNGDIVGDCLP